MPPTKIVAKAFSPMENLAKWVHESAKMKQEKNLLKCVDDDLHDKTLPLLEALEYHEIEVNRGMDMLQWICS
jgi:hypothetical protein